MAKTVIGIDFGNYNTFPCFITDMDPVTRKGGIVHDLLPAKSPEGIPSVFYYSRQKGVLVGKAALRTPAREYEQRLRYLKRHLGEPLTIDGRQMSYDDAIVEVLQYCIRKANQELNKGWLCTTNEISLSYPASYTFAQRQHLIELAEKATLEDGKTKVKVCGTIAEPAAAALDYLSEFAHTDRETTLLTYDLGGGTFDLALVSAYPNGRRSSNGQTYYYDIINTRGIARLGGAEFDEAMYTLLSRKARVDLEKNEKAALRRMAEEMKIHLSDSTEDTQSLYVRGDYIDLTVTRDEFEHATKSLLDRTIEAMRQILNDHKDNAPKDILLTGGASQMPMVKNGIEAAFPEYRGHVILFRPSKAIAYGAARYGTTEGNSDPSSGAVQQRVMYDIGVRFFEDEFDETGHICTYIPAGTPLPFSGTFRKSCTLSDNQQTSCFAVFEAKVQHPDQKQPIRDYTKIMCVELHRNSGNPKGTPSETRLGVDRLGCLTIEARDLSLPGKPAIKNSVTLQNLH